MTVLFAGLTSSLGGPGLSIDALDESEQSRRGNRCSMETWDGLRLSISGWDQTRPNQTLTGNGLSAQNSSPRLRTGGYSGEELTPDLGGSWRNTNDRLTGGTFATSWPAQRWGPSCDQRNIGYEKERVALQGVGTLSFSEAFILGGGVGGSPTPSREQ